MESKQQNNNALSDKSAIHRLESLCKNPLVWVMLIALIFRAFIDPMGFLDPKRSGKPHLESPDVPSYLKDANLKELLFSGEVNIERTPAYLIFTGLHRQLFGEDAMFGWIVFSQRMLSLISVFFFYRIGEYFLKSRICVVLATLLYVVAVSALLFNNWILTESLAVSFAVCWFFCLMAYVQKPTRLKAFLSGLGVFLLIMLRPAFMGLLLLIFVFWGMRLLFQREHFKKDLIGLLYAVLSLVLIFGYCHQFYKKTGIFSVTVLGVSNQFICMIQSELFQKDDSPISRRMQTALTEYKKIFPEKANDLRLLTRPRVWTYPDDPINFITEKVRQDGLMPPMNERRIYTQRMIRTYPYDYAKFIAGKFLQEKKLFPIYVFILTELFLIFALWKQSRRIPILHWIFWLMIAGLLFTAVAGAQDEYFRLSLPVVPFVILIPFQCLDVWMNFLKLNSNQRPTD
ncbi:MAG: hypothetical protein LBJ67_11060 [Planctomycetaceae bacterium]|jgi:hypothetical protein|nr:hypothetical protein [Planctomycetaceae bacterium]